MGDHQIELLQVIAEYLNDQGFGFKPRYRGAFWYDVDKRLAETVRIYIMDGCVCVHCMDQAYGEPVESVELADPRCFDLLVLMIRAAIAED